MQHHRMLAVIVLTDVFSTQTNRQIEVQLQRTALPDPAEAIFQREFDLVRKRTERMERQRWQSARRSR
ncbi:hypothetical protein SSTU70S_02731 [Stutzerimonas stutzeri]